MKCGITSRSLIRLLLVSWTRLQHIQKIAAVHDVPEALGVLAVLQDEFFVMVDSVLNILGEEGRAGMESCLMGIFVEELADLFSREVDEQVVEHKAVLPKS